MLNVSVRARPFTRDHHRLRNDVGSIVDLDTTGPIFRISKRNFSYSGTSLG